MRNWYRAFKSNNTVIFANEKTNRAFKVELEGETVMSVSRMMLHVPEEKGKKLTTAEQEHIFELVRKFISANTENCYCDGYPITVCRSAAGYYIGCFCEDGPYCRLSDYSDHKEEIWCYFNENYAER